MPFVDYDDLSERQQMEARLLRPKWNRDDFPRFAFFVCEDGHVSKRGGHHTPTDAENAKVNAELDALFTEGNRPDKGGIRHFRTAVFGERGKR